MYNAFLAARLAWPVAMGLALLVPASGAAAPLSVTAGEAGWINVTGNVGGETWGYAGVCKLAAVPGSRRVIAGVSEAGLWATDDGGGPWFRLNGKGTTKITHRTHSIVFDPGDPRVLWVTGSYGPGIFKSVDGGESFVQLGTLAHVDGIAIDFTDPRRATLVVGLHEQTLSLHRSSDGGVTWKKIGDTLPPDSNFPSDPILLSGKVLLTSTAGWARNKSWGIRRSEDGGQTWRTVSAAGPAGPALTASDGTIYWALLWKSGLLKSSDQGKTWKSLKTPTTTSPIELPGGSLAAAGGDQVYRSADAGATWRPLGPRLPYKVNGVIYSSGLHSVLAWRSSEKKVPDAIVRWKLPREAGE